MLENLNATDQFLDLWLGWEGIGRIFWMEIFVMIEGDIRILDDDTSFSISPSNSQSFISRAS
jgi:hypothetical protein